MVHVTQGDVESYHGGVLHCVVSIPQLMEDCSEVGSTEEGDLLKHKGGDINCFRECEEQLVGIEVKIKGDEFRRCAVLSKHIHLLRV